MKLLCLFASLCLLALPCSLNAQPDVYHVPFSFVAFDSDFPAGDYIVTAQTYNLKLALAGAPRTSKYLTAQPGRAMEFSGLNTMVFEKIGDLYVLREYRIGALGAVRALPLSKSRREVVRSYIAKGYRPEPVLIAAGL